MSSQSISELMDNLDVHCVKCQPAFATLIHDALKTERPLFPSKPLSKSFIAINKAILECERILRGYQLMTQLLKAKRNELAAIHYLPDEILESIFLETIDQEGGSWAVVPFSHVCRRWRGVALQSPRLWTAIILLGKRRDIHVDRILYRAQNLPITVSGRAFNIPGATNTLKLWVWIFRTYWAQIRHVHMFVAGEESHFGNRFWKGVTSLPQLLTMRLSLRNFDQEDADDFVRHLHRINRPGLRGMFVKSDRYLNPGHLVTSTLTTFHFVMVDDVTWDSNFNQQVVSAISSALRTMPLLASLKLDWGISGSLTARHTEPVLHLSHLQTLSLFLPPNTSIWILDWLQYPPQTDVKLLVRLRDVKAQDLPSLHSTLEFLLGYEVWSDQPVSYDVEAQARIHKSNVFGVDYAHSLLLSLTRQQPQPHHPTGLLSLYLEHAAPSGFYAPPSPQEIWDIVPHVIQEQVHGFTIGYMPPDATYLYKIKWPDVLLRVAQCSGQMTATRHLTIWGWKWRDMMNASHDPLVISPATPGRETDHPFLFPNLQKVTFESMSGRFTDGEVDALKVILLRWSEIRGPQLRVRFVGCSRVKDRDFCDVASIINRL
ncbi:hypothetical protein BXZ70DRAFT_478684 [Cristinia sonorae]|uniref:F-box domain-containing protein n=1 Tax=Cristinia sonorae TaxID=1940300 RepID=A0A8K0UH68_9AGAR|nr:hypothetical protein BXZ70DRAFT_478684 [Cristinia sonorae]